MNDGVLTLPHLRKWMSIGLGASAVLVGAVTFWLPIPIGLPLMLLGAPLLVRHSPHARRWLALALDRFPGIKRRMRRRFPQLAARMKEAFRQAREQRRRGRRRA